MFKCALKASTELTIEGLKSSATAAHKYYIYMLTVVSGEEIDLTTLGSL
mgnify:CR=1 FL=1